MAKKDNSLKYKISKLRTTKSKIFLVAIIVGVLAILFICFIKYRNLYNQSAALPNIPTLTPTPKPFSILEVDLNTDNWKTYELKDLRSDSSKTFYSIKHPSEWNFTKKSLAAAYFPYKPYSSESGKGVILLGAGGHGWSHPIYKRAFPAGDARYSWNVEDNKVFAFANFEISGNEYIFEILNVPVTDENEAQTFKRIFDTMLSTFKKAE